MQNVEEVGYVYKRVKRGRRRKSFDFERKPAVKLPAANGTVLLKPLPAVSSAGHTITTVKPVKRATVQLATKPKVHTPAPKIPRNTNGSAQWSPLIVGIGKSACVGDKF